MISTRVMVREISLLSQEPMEDKGFHLVCISFFLFLSSPGFEAHSWIGTINKFLNVS